MNASLTQLEVKRLGNMVESWEYGLLRDNDHSPNGFFGEIRTPNGSRFAESVCLFLPNRAPGKKRTLEFYYAPVDSSTKPFVTYQGEGAEEVHELVIKKTEEQQRRKDEDRAEAYRIKRLKEMTEEKRIEEAGIPYLRQILEGGKK